MIVRKRLPIGIQTFREIREGNHYYVDKTQLVVKLADEGKHYFLSRPRRFGKSLLLDTFKELFEGNEPLFKDLAAEKQWDWSVKYPVLRFDFGDGNYSSTENLEQHVSEQLTEHERFWNIDSEYSTHSGRFKHLIRQVKQQMGQPAVILIDEYDKPILDRLRDPEISRSNRDFLRSFYAVIKSSDANIKFSFLTGVSKFSRVSLFSGLNNLYDLTMIPEYSALCGYTDNDIDSVFAAELEGLDRDKIREWYNGYHWRGEKVYNPFDVLQLFKNREFGNYWFESGTPTFLVDTLFERQITTLRLNNMLSNTEMLSSFDVGQIDTEALLFQTGYLTIKKEERIANQDFYTLGYPNLEVAQSLNGILLSVLVQNKARQVENSTQLHHLLLANDFDGLKQLFHAFFASIPNTWYNHGSIQSYEGYYASVFYSYFASLGLDITVEDMTNLGRIDMTLKFNEQVYIFEFKVIENGGDGAAMAQLHEKQYADKYKALQQPIYLLGVEFSKESRNVEVFEVERVDNV